MKVALHYLAYLLFRTMEFLVAITPVSVGIRIGRGVGRLAFWLDRRHRRIAIENIRAVYGNRLTPREARRLALSSFIHLGAVSAESVYLPRLMTPATWQRHVVLHGYGRFLRLMLSERGGIVLTGHLGNWELTAFCSAAMGFTPFSVARPPSNPFIARRVRELRERSGQELIDKEGALEAMQEVLRSGGVVGFLADQYAGQHGVWVDFLGRPASTHKGIALLALTMNVPILVLYTYRFKPGLHYVIRFEDLIEPGDYAHDPEAVRNITQRYTTVLGRAVTAYPDQWLWAHRRWRPRRGRNAAAQNPVPGDRSGHGPTGD